MLLPIKFRIIGLRGILLIGHAALLHVASPQFDAHAGLSHIQPNFELLISQLKLGIYSSSNSNNKRKVDINPHIEVPYIYDKCNQKVNEFFRKILEILRKFFSDFFLKKFSGVFLASFL